MRSISLSKTVNAPAQSAYRAVAESWRYHEFLPCDVAGPSVDLAKGGSGRFVMRIFLGPFSVELSTENSFSPPSSVSIRLAEPGTLKRFDAHWSVVPESSQTCKMTFKANLEVAGEAVAFFVERAMEAMLESVCESFCKRAEELFQEQGRKQGPLDPPQ